MQYIARLTIHNGTYQDYENLHSYMKQRGFRRYITAATGVHYWLPDATYIIDSMADIDSVYKAAHAAAKAASRGTEPQVLVAEYGKATFSGLTVAK
ncbi:hypothetical protein K2O51_23240 [Cupriavidus pinatubonensis]|uniref:hypothetical protein n=1 Tax=Cupriavidus pinatubonensis TaxID=248026 RepID=UPI001C733FD2|nr:hypothetical protein [Cupriavidus pinatubonensis]QYY30287.1 hypothetical protein K2O51_23240 [Cupriavidus pinatubonensis]